MVIMYISCSICNVVKSNSQISATRCGHIFHNQCLAQRLKQSEFCPLCRKKCPPRKVIPLFLHNSSMIAEPTENVFIMQNTISLQIELDNANKLIEQLIMKMSENETKLEENDRILKTTLVSSEQCLSMNLMLKRQLAEARMMNSYSHSLSLTNLNISQNYRHSVQATAPAWDDVK